LGERKSPQQFVLEFSGGMIWILVDSSSVGGIERHVATLAEALRRASLDTEIVLLAAHGNNPWLQQLDEARLPYRLLDGSVSGLHSALRTARPQLLHTHGYKANIMGRLSARLLGIPVISTFHAGERGAFPVSAYQLVDEYSSILGGRLCVSEVIRKQLPYNATLIENFMVAPLLPPAPEMPRRIGFVGRLSVEKAPDLFCELARRCAGPDEWHIWGDGPMRSELERAYGAHVHFHGLVTDLRTAWNSLGLLVMPSRAEGLPMAALESLAAGVPIVASAVGGLPSVVHDGRTGWLFETGNLDDARARIETWRALPMPEQAHMRLNCWNFVKEHFSETKQLPKILAAYRAVGFKHDVIARPDVPAT
jgi:glycosyltransferase involved in cell wall biosynthesis